MEKKLQQVVLNKAVPEFSLMATGNQLISLSDLKSQHKNCVIYFYPKDCTSGCTLEGQQFRDEYAQFKKLNTEIFGVSRDTLQLHEKFKHQEKFPFELLSDTEQKICELFDVIKPKNMYGKTVKGIERSTFLIDNNGILIHEWRGVKADGHAKEVLAMVKKYFNK